MSRWLISNATFSSFKFHKGWKSIFQLIFVSCTGQKFLRILPCKIQFHPTQTKTKLRKRVNRSFLFIYHALVWHTPRYFISYSNTNTLRYTWIWYHKRNSSSIVNWNIFKGAMFDTSLCRKGKKININRTKTCKMFHSTVMILDDEKQTKSIKSYTRIYIFFFCVFVYYIAIHTQHLSIFVVFFHPTFPNTSIWLLHTFYLIWVQFLFQVWIFGPI